MSRWEKAHWHDWDPSETLVWGSLEIVGVANGLVGNHSDKVLEKRGFSLFCHEYLQVIRHEGKDWVEGCDTKSRPHSAPSAVTSSQTRFSISWRWVLCCLGWFS